VNRGLNPYKRLGKRYVFEYVPDAEITQDDIYNRETADGRLIKDESEGIHISKISAVTFYEDSVIVYDEGMLYVLILTEWQDRLSIVIVVIDFTLFQS
jgi:hypothetical protein